MVWAFYRYGALPVAIETIVCIRNSVHLRKLYFKCHIFIFYIEKLEQIIKLILAIDICQNVLNF